MVGPDKFYFNLKSSVPRRLELWSHERLMPTQSQVSQCLLCERAFGVQTKDVICSSFKHVSVKSNNVAIPLIRLSATN